MIIITFHQQAQLQKNMKTGNKPEAMQARGHAVVFPLSRSPLSPSPPPTTFTGQGQAASLVTELEAELELQIDTSLSNLTNLSPLRISIS